VPRIFDNMDLTLVSALKENLLAARRVDISVGYFNLRGSRLIDLLIEALPGDEGVCRLIVGMQRSPREELRRTLSLSKDGERIDAKEARRLIRTVTEQFRDQLQIGAPTDADEAGVFGDSLLCENEDKRLRSNGGTLKLKLRALLTGGASERLELARASR
jgi:hypothetical protein